MVVNNVIGADVMRLQQNPADFPYIARLWAQKRFISQCQFRSDMSGFGLKSAIMRRKGISVSHVYAITTKDMPNPVSPYAISDLVELYEIKPLQTLDDFEEFR